MNDYNERLFINISNLTSLIPKFNKLAIKNSNKINTAKADFIYFEQGYICISINNKLSFSITRSMPYKYIVYKNTIIANIYNLNIYEIEEYIDIHPNIKKLIINVIPNTPNDHTRLKEQIKYIKLNEKIRIILNGKCTVDGKIKTLKNVRWYNIGDLRYHVFFNDNNLLYRIIIKTNYHIDKIIIIYGNDEKYNTDTIVNNCTRILEDISNWG